MSDIERAEAHPLALKDAHLHKKLIEIKINEKICQIRQLDTTLEKIKTVEFKKIEYQKEILEREIEECQQQLVQLGIPIQEAEIIKIQNS